MCYYFFMEKPHIFTAVAAEAPYDKILYRMGYKNGLTEMDASQKAKIDAGIALGRSLCSLKTAYLRCDVEKEGTGSVKLKNGIEFKSNTLCEFMRGCKEIVLMASTAGQRVVDARDREMAAGNAALSIIIDAAASETADAGLDWMQNFINKTLSREGMELTRRYSPGYGDFDLSAQKQVFDSLCLNRLGIGINERHILTPEKSVLAVAGVRARTG